MASVFDLQKRSRRLSWLLLILFSACVLLIAYAYSLVIGYFWPQATPVVFALGLGIPLAISCYHYSQLLQGGSAIARIFGGRRLWHSGRLGQSDVAHAKPLEPQELTLLNVVDEISIAANFSPPRVFVLDKQLGINAFVCGHHKSDLTLVVTEGLLTYLNREEIAGVIAHEYSHLKYGDNILNLRLLAVTKGLNWISDSVDHIPTNRTKMDNRWAREIAPLGFLMVILVYIIGWLGSACCSLIKSAVLRQREYLADAAGTQFVRSDGLINALYKIAEHSNQGFIRHPRSKDFSHFAFTVTSGFGLNASHPPIDKRILRLKPNFARKAALQRLLGADPAAPSQQHTNTPTPALMPIEYSPVATITEPATTWQAQPAPESLGGPALDLTAVLGLLNIEHSTWQQRMHMLLYLLHSYSHSAQHNPVKPSADIAYVASVNPAQRIFVILKLIHAISEESYSQGADCLWQSHFKQLLYNEQPVRFITLVLLACLKQRLAHAVPIDVAPSSHAQLLYHWAAWLVGLSATAASKTPSTLQRLLKPFANGTLHLNTTGLHTLASHITTPTAASLLACIQHFSQLPHAERNRVYWLTDQALFVDLLLSQDEEDGLLVLKILLQLD